ncbi:MAG TPA: hypothetical protein VHS31_15170 [Tepidisphaeraceae bacterium]|jgi:hypothetical protein|nr:hypothetical protein [Tepidisphaeraceae bacterium]
MPVQAGGIDAAGGGMIELIDTFPDVNVDPAEYKRLLGYPPERVLEGRARELADLTRAWYAKNGKPWVYARQVETLQIINGSILIEGTTFSSPRLQKTLQEAEAHSAILVAVSAGPELEREAQQCWADEKPDEYFFLEVFGSAVVEHLTTMTGARLCAWAERDGMAVLPHYSPGYPEWDISQQPELRGLMKSLPAARGVEVMESGMLRPKKSLLAVFGLTRHIDRVRKLSDLIPCENCSFSPCQYRRASYRRTRVPSETELLAIPSNKSEDVSSIAPALDHLAKYLVNIKALERWAGERLELKFHHDGTIDAMFRYEGTTCSNMGRALVFHYHVKLGRREEGYPIREQKCRPAPGDEGHRFMCRYMNNAEHLMTAIDHEKPLLGRPLNEVISWHRPMMGSGCYCEPEHRMHKWGLVLETIHFALVRWEKAHENDAKPVSPSPGIPGEGRGEGSRDSSSSLEDQTSNIQHRTFNVEKEMRPHPNPLPEYRARGSEGALIQETYKRERSE